MTHKQNMWDATYAFIMYYKIARIDLFETREKKTDIEKFQKKYKKMNNLLLF